ncbi:hypothetical protein DOT_5010 [Desulfosporosinus sp. OT]|nr:hypothetical protein DOT_5010 [Desulfosporosinus sp. OT]
MFWIELFEKQIIVTVLLINKVAIGTMHRTYTEEWRSM